MGDEMALAVGSQRWLTFCHVCWFSYRRLKLNCSLELPNVKLSARMEIRPLLQCLFLKVTFQMSYKFGEANSVAPCTLIYINRILFVIQ